LEKIVFYCHVTAQRNCYIHRRRLHGNELRVNRPTVKRARGGTLTECLHNTLFNTTVTTGAIFSSECTGHYLVGGIHLHPCGSFSAPKIP